MGFDLLASVRHGASIGMDYAKKGVTAGSNYVRAGYVLVFADKGDRAYSKEVYSYDKALQIRNTIYNIRKKRRLPYRAIKIITKSEVARKRQERLGQSIQLIGTSTQFHAPKSRSRKNPYDIFGDAFK